MHFNFDKFRSTKGNTIQAVDNKMVFTVPSDELQKAVAYTIDGRTFLWIHKDFRLAQNKVGK